MNFSPENGLIVLNLIEDGLKQDMQPHFKVKNVWTRIAIARMRALTNGLRQIVGDTVAGGPFKGMKLTEKALNQYNCAALLGCYEHELHPTVEKIITENYPRILNIGCSVGYYAIGLALRMPNAIIDAYDIDREAQAKCAEMAQANHVTDRVHIAGQFYGDDFARYADQKTILFMDIEGAEADLLQPDRYPALQKMDIVVELHDVMVPGLSQTICQRFAATHDIELIRNRNFLPDVSAILPNTDLDAFDQLLMGWEGRDGPTPWGIFRAKNR